MTQRTKRRGRRDRRGAMMAMVGVFLFAFIAVGAVAVDVSRLFAIKNQLQTAADAGALAGAIEFLRPDRSQALTIAETYVKKHSVGVDPITIVSIEPVRWNDKLVGSAETKWTPSTLLDANAIRVVVEYPAAYWWAWVTGESGKTIRTESIAWAEAPVNKTKDCVKPWAIPYELLTRRLDPNNPDVYRTLTEADKQALRDIVNSGQAPQLLNFILKNGSGSNGSDPDQPSGNYFPVTLPAECRVATLTCSPSPMGVPPYKQNIYNPAYPETNGCDPNQPPLEVGDLLLTEPGNMVGPTIDATQQLCGGPCDNVEIPIKAAFWIPVTDEARQWAGSYSTGNGRTMLEVKIIGSFVLTGLRTDEKDCDKKTDPFCAKSAIQGYFTSLQDDGSVGEVNSTIQKPILVH